MKHDSMVPEGLLRLSIGLEDPKDIINDLKAALKVVKEKVKEAQDKAKSSKK